MADSESTNISKKIQEKTVGFTFCTADQCSAYSNIRKINEAEIKNTIESLRGTGWDADHLIVAVELAPAPGSEEAKSYPTSLLKLKEMSIEEVSIYRCLIYGDSTTLSFQMPFYGTFLVYFLILF